MPNAKQKAIKERFLKDVETHVMTVELDVGMHRRIVCRRPQSSTYWFEIVTWPGHLAIVGDMGAHVFRREHDMFEWFLGSLSNTTDLNINESYWTQKLQAHDKDGVTQLNKESLRASCLAVLAWRVDLTKKRRAKTLARVESLVRDVATEDDAHRRIYNFKVKGDPLFFDTFEWNLAEPTPHYTWCLFAIVWTIQQYNAQKAETATTEEPD